MKLPDKVYDVLKWVVMIVIPALTTAYVGLAAIWGWPLATEVAKIYVVRLWNPSIRDRYKQRILCHARLHAHRQAGKCKTDRSVKSGDVPPHREQLLL